MVLRNKSLILNVTKLNIRFDLSPNTFKNIKLLSLITQYTIQVRLFELVITNKNILII